jgi:hypothetical protein
MVPFDDISLKPFYSPIASATSCGFGQKSRVDHVVRDYGDIRDVLDKIDPLV